MSQLIGALLLTVISFVMLASFADTLFAAQPDPIASAPIDISLALSAGTGRWGGGDEAVLITHKGGEPLYQDSTQVHVSISGAITIYQGAALDGAFADGRLSVGETWQVTRLIPPNAQVDVLVVRDVGHGEIVSKGRLLAGKEDCSGDTAPPIVEAWTRTPGDVTTLTTGSVLVTANLADRCAGLDLSVLPRLHYRINSGNGGAFTDLGAMTQLSATMFQLAIPEPGAGGWSSHDNETLEFYVSPLTDVAGNTGPSVTRSDTIEHATLAPTLNYVASFVAYSGTLTDLANAQVASDAGIAATLTEASQGAGTVVNQLHATAHTSAGAINASDATGSPDDAHAVLSDNGHAVGVSGFTTFSGTIETVELVYEAHYVGTISGTADDLEITYEVAGTTGATGSILPLDTLPADSDGAPQYVNITADRTWQWADIGNLAVAATYRKNQALDPATIHIDALWLRVRYDGGTYNMSIRLDVNNVPAATTDTVELRYKVTNETFVVDVWNFTSSSWTQHGTGLTETALALWTTTLNGHEVSSGDVRVRVRDAGTGGTSQGKLEIDYLRVSST